MAKSQGCSNHLSDCWSAKTEGKDSANLTARMIRLITEFDDRGENEVSSKVNKDHFWQFNLSFP